MKKQKAISVLAAAALMVGLCSCGGGNGAVSTGTGSGGTPQNSSGAQGSTANATYEWKAANVLAAGEPWDVGLQEFARLLNEKSDGAITLEVFNSGTLGQERDTIEGLQIGSVDFVICSSATLSNFTDTQNIWDFPICS